MSNKLIDMQEIRQIIQLALQGHSERRISEQTGVHRKSVKKYLSKANNSGESMKDLLAFSDEALAVILLEAAAEVVSLFCIRTQTGWGNQTTSSSGLFAVKP
jgi:hypothetical protein